jgi:precorrin-2 methylase
MKVGRHLDDVAAAVRAAGRSRGAVYVERASLPDARIASIDEVAGTVAPYFSLVLVPGMRIGAATPASA